MANSDLYVKRATVNALKTHVAVLARMTADRVYPIQRPANVSWPFIGLGVPISEPFVGSCLNGSQCSFAVHNYAETTGTGGATKSGEDEAMLTNAAIETALDGATIDLTERGCPYPATAHYTCTGSQVIQDGNEAGKFHGFVSFRVTVSS